jgi:hypothetical protein
VISLENVALTVDPATHRAPKLVAASLGLEVELDEDETTTAALSAQEKPMAKNKLAKFISNRMAEHEMEPDELAKHVRLTTEKLNKFAKGEESPDEEEMGRLAKAFSCKSSHMSKLAGEADDEPAAGKAAPTPSGGAPSKSQADDAYEKAKKAGQTADLSSPGAKDGKVPAEGADKKPSGFQLSALSAMIESETDPVKKGLFAALGASVEHVSTLSKQVTDLASKFEAQEKASTEKTLEQLLDQGIEEGKLTPATRTALSSLGIDGLRSYLAAAPQIGPGRPAAVQGKRPVATGLTGASKRNFEAVSTLSGRSAEEIEKNYLARKEAEAKRSAELGYDA